MRIIHAHINSPGIYRKVDGIIKRAKRRELRTRSIKILSARRGLSCHAPPLKVRGFFYLLDTRVSARVEFLTEPRRCTRPTVWKIRGGAQRPKPVFFSTFIKILESVSISPLVFVGASPEFFRSLHFLHIPPRSLSFPPKPSAPFFLPVDGRLELRCFNTDRYLSRAD